MTGVVLAGGMGTRLRPMTEITNKHLLTVYDRPMIDYPIQTLKDMGCNDIVLVSGGEHIGGFAEYLGEGITYKVQKKAAGIADALAQVKGLVHGLFPVILGDNYFDSAPLMPEKPTIYYKNVDNPNRYGVYYQGKIYEKPIKDLGHKAIIGLYVYDEWVFDYLRGLTMSERGEYEITDINNIYLKHGMQIEEYKGYWSDMGTPDSLLEVANYVKNSSL